MQVFIINNIAYLPKTRPRFGSFRYDANKNLTTQDRGTPGSSADDYSFDRTVDAKDRLTNWLRDNGDNQDWDLSFEGDWTQTDGSIGGTAFDQSRTHNGPHEILTIDPDNAGPLTPVTITHDAKGNLTQDNTGLAHTYDFDNLLEQVVVSGSATRGVEGTHTYAYDALGRRVSKTVDTDADNTPDETTVFVCSGLRVLAEYEDATGLGATTPARKYLYSRTDYVDKPLVLVDRSSAGGSAAGTEELIYYFYDGRHNVIGLMNASVQQPERYAYTPYGVRLVMTSGHVALASTAYGNHRGFQGLYHDEETGLIYNRARTLDPETGRFLQRDPLGYPDGMNSYAAYHVMWGGVDPWGLDNQEPNSVITVPKIPGDAPPPPPKEEGKYSPQYYEQDAVNELLKADPNNFGKIEEIEGKGTFTEKLIKRCGKNKCIESLDIIGHGDVAQIWLNSSTNKPKEQDVVSVTEKDGELVVNNIGVFKGIPFCENCVIILRSCNTGFGNKGQFLIQQIKTKAGCEVRAFSDLCWPGKDGGLPGLDEEDPRPDVTTADDQEGGGLTPS